MVVPCSLLLLGYDPASLFSCTVEIEEWILEARSVSCRTVVGFVEVHCVLVQILVFDSSVLSLALDQASLGVLVSRSVEVCYFS